jgi:5-methylcytosine-specific restriction endonuclease McrA
MSKRSKACDITPKVRAEVMGRDKHCISCGSHSTLSLAHVWVNRSHGGLGIKENLCVLCMSCHGKLDNGLGHQSDIVRINVESYMKRLYGTPDIDKLKYKKWR